MKEDPECICRGNWREIIKETAPLLGKRFVREDDGQEFTLFGIVHGDDDYYYGVNHLNHPVYPYHSKQCSAARKALE